MRFLRSDTMPNVVLIAPHPACASLDPSQLANAAAVAAHNVDRDTVSVASDVSCLLPYPTSVKRSETCHVGSLACRLGDSISSRYTVDDAASSGDADCALPRLSLTALCSEAGRMFVEAACRQAESANTEFICIPCHTSDLVRRTAFRLGEMGCTIAAGVEVGGVASVRPPSVAKVLDPKGKAPREVTPADTDLADPSALLFGICGLGKGPTANDPAPTFPPELIAGLARSVATVVKQVPLPGVSWSHRVVAEVAAPLPKRGKGNTTARGASPAKVSDQPTEPAPSDLSSKLIAVQSYLFLNPPTEVVVAASIEAYLTSIIFACIHHFDAALGGHEAGITSERAARFAALTRVQTFSAFTRLMSPHSPEEAKPPSNKGSRPLSQSITARGPSVFEDHILLADSSVGGQFANSLERLQQSTLLSVSKGDIPNAIDDFVSKVTTERNAVVALLSEVSLILGQLRSNRRDLGIAHHFPQLSSQSTVAAAKGKAAEKGPYTKGSQVLVALGALVASLADSTGGATSQQDRLVGGLLSGALSALFDVVPLTMSKLEVAAAAASSVQVSQGKHQQQQATNASQILAQTAAAADAYATNVERFFETQSALFGRLASAPVLPRIPTPSSSSEVLPVHTCLFLLKHRPIRRYLSVLQTATFRLGMLICGSPIRSVNDELRLLCPAPMSCHVVGGPDTHQDSIRSPSVARSNADAEVSVTVTSSNLPGTVGLVSVSVTSNKKVDEAIATGMGAALGWIVGRPTAHHPGLPQVAVSCSQQPSMRLSGKAAVTRPTSDLANGCPRPLLDEYPRVDADEGRRFILDVVDVESYNLRRISKGLARARLGDQVRRTTLPPCTDLTNVSSANGKRKSIDPANAKPTSKKATTRLQAASSETPANEVGTRPANDGGDQENLRRLATLEEPLPRAGSLVYERRSDVEVRHAAEGAILRKGLGPGTLSKMIVGAFFDETFGVDDETSCDAYDQHARHRDRVRNVCSALADSSGPRGAELLQRQVGSFLTHPTLVPIHEEESGIVGLLTDYIRGQGGADGASGTEGRQVIQTIDSDGGPLLIPAAGASEKVLSLVNNTLTSTEQQYLLDQVAVEQLAKSSFPLLTSRFSTYSYTMLEDHICEESEGGFLPPPQVVKKVAFLRSLFPNNVSVATAGAGVADTLSLGVFRSDSARYTRNSMLHETTGYLAVGLSHVSTSALPQSRGPSAPHRH